MPIAPLKKVPANLPRNAPHPDFIALSTFFCRNHSTRKAPTNAPINAPITAPIPKKNGIPKIPPIIPKTIVRFNPYESFRSTELIDKTGEIIQIPHLFYRSFPITGLMKILYLLESIVKHSKILI